MSACHSRIRRAMVVNVQHLRLDAERLGASFHFRRSPERQRPAGHREMAYVAVGSRHELDLMPLRGPLRSHAGRLQLTIVWVRAKRDNSQCHFQTSIKSAPIVYDVNVGAVIPLIFRSQHRHALSERPESARKHTAIGRDARRAYSGD